MLICVCLRILASSRIPRYDLGRQTLIFEVVLSQKWWSSWSKGVHEHDWPPLVPHVNKAGHSVRCVSVCMLSSFPTLFTLASDSTDLLVLQIHTRIWDLVLCFFIAWSCCLFCCWFCVLWNWSKQNFKYMSLSWIFACLLVFSQTNFCCTIHHRGWVCSYY
jgi:hypothetical protein